MFILGISAFYHDSAACLLKDEDIVAAAQEERFTRIKNDASFPFNAITFCLSYAGINLREVDYIVLYEKPFLRFERLVETYAAFAPKGLFSFLRSMPLWLKDKLFQKRKIIKGLQQIDSGWKYKSDKLLFTKHHQAHAASAFFPSPFNEALILTLDGVGEWNTTSVSKGFENNINPVKEINFPHSIGLLYSAFTYFLGFKVNADEYKVMGLAPYGAPKYEAIIYKYLIDVKPDGSFRLNMKYFNYCTGLTMTTHNFNDLFNAAPRKPGSAIIEFHMDMASSIQKVTEEVILKMLNHLAGEFEIENLCLAGGVALNCVVNGKIIKQTPFKNLWIQPAAGDAGGALGAAYFVYYQHLKNIRTTGLSVSDKMQHSFLGPSFKTAEVKEFLLNKKVQFTEYDEAAFCKKLATEMANGKIVGWFNGRMEFGPRALGARSILADAGNKKMQSRINSVIKFRESFRPFAPAILQEYANKYFHLDVSSPYMLLVAEIRKEHQLKLTTEEMNYKGLNKLKQNRSILPAVTHVDYSARIQTVNPVENPKFYQLIRAFYELTGCPAIVNTSFNVINEPIVCTPAEALNCYLNTAMDILAIENLVVEK